MYRFCPLSIRSRGAILEHEALGQTARFERYVADLLYVLACGGHIDSKQAQRFGDVVDRVYHSPFEENRGPQTAAEIKQYILQILEA